MGEHASKVRWGIVGLGRIAHKFVGDLMLTPGARVVAVGSRDITRARDFADQYGIESTLGSYEGVFSHPDVDIVYVATVHTTHAELSIAAMEHGKHVCCEKPFAINTAQAENVIATSKRTGCFFMEAFWSRFIPAVKQVIDRSQNGDIGEVRYIQADFAFRVDAQPESRALNIDKAGGALLDIGVYPLFLAYSILGTPQRIQASALFDDGGADLQTAMLLDYPSARAVLYCGFESRSNMVATVSGSKGRFVLHPVWHHADAYSMLSDSNKEQRLEAPRDGHGFIHEILECQQCINEGERESSVWSHQNSLDLVGMTDEVRRQVGLIYPFE